MIGWGYSAIGWQFNTTAGLFCACSSAVSQKLLLTASSNVQLNAMVLVRTRTVGTGAVVTFMSVVSADKVGIRLGETRWRRNAYPSLPCSRRAPPPRAAVGA